jgi:DNA-binding GntR family transcriptional regulator
LSIGARAEPAGSTPDTSETAGGGGSKVELAYELLRSRIAERVYEPGTRLVMNQLAVDLDMSPVPVREAIRRLEAEGFVEFTRHVGAKVADIDLAGYLQTMETLAVLEAGAVALALPAIGRKELKRAWKAHRAMVRLAEGSLDPVAFSRLNEELHRSLFSCCPNTRLLSLVETEWSRLSAIRRSSFAFVPGRSLASVSEHRVLLDAIEGGAAVATVEGLVKEHRMTAARVLAEWDARTAPGSARSDEEESA